jgi:hypothetical protein
VLRGHRRPGGPVVRMLRDLAWRMYYSTLLYSLRLFVFLLIFGA